MDLYAELAETRAWITELHADMNHPTYPNRPWEHRHNLEGRLAYLTHRETELVDQIAADEENIDRLVRAALASGDPAVFAVTYVIAGTTTARAGLHTGTLAA
ncbi:hypothetical protein [Streptomyces ossamyceticus]|uniref:hypothetical protein n=1 Tax=Streptomyces ossamyceticus TaxID=249581 RepID=UPI0006E2697C|nr:hypothetical protein [Streptomyces ossamyceticus]